MKIAFVLGMLCAWNLMADAREKMGLIELLTTIKKICNKNSNKLWERVIKCHDPITADFLRASDEAYCPRTFSDPDPKDPNVSLQRIFQIICNAVGWNPIIKLKSLACLGIGHYAEVELTQQKFGQNVPENIVKCIRAINIDDY